ncbi:hypothetical protein GHK86_09255 [Acidimicrobiaceae bacterium USS-CC1]|uniref:DUF4397 domain-containing protein n=1 Tax=Acidiferrimicrobium australe TaxID=2664430 RepID=A0ABW9QU08_9ACTN|nr:hypothetical protein [Acidiferrimicrobium australe]
MSRIRDVLRRNLIVASIVALFVVGLVVSGAATGGFKASLASSSSCGYGYTCPPPSTTTTAPSTTISATNRTGPGDVVISGTTAGNTTVKLYDEWYGRSYYVYKATTTSSSSGAYSFTVHIDRTNHFYVVVNGTKSASVAAVVSLTKVYVTPPPANRPGTVSVRVTTNQANAVIHLFDLYAGARYYVQKAVHVAEPIAYGNGVWTFQITNVRATNHFFAVVNGVKSNTVTALIK